MKKRLKSEFITSGKDLELLVNLSQFNSIKIQKNYIFQNIFFGFKHLFINLEKYDF